MRLDPLTKVVFLCLVIVWAPVGCASRPAIVSDPPQHVRQPTEQIPWEEQYSRAMVRPEAVENSATVSDIHDEQKFSGSLEGKEESGPLDVVVDVIAFPFRAIGWLFQSIF
jgi:hypothetical protein